MLRVLLGRQEYRLGALQDSACERELTINPDRQLTLFRWGSHVLRATQKSTHCHIQLQVCTLLASQRRAHQCNGDALDLVIPTSGRVALPRLSNDDQEHILAWRSDRRILADKRQIGRATSR